MYSALSVFRFQFVERPGIQCPCGTGFHTDRLGVVNPSVYAKITLLHSGVYFLAKLGRPVRTGLGTRISATEAPLCFFDDLVIRQSHLNFCKTFGAILRRYLWCLGAFGRMIFFRLCFGHGRPIFLSGFAKVGTPQVATDGYRKKPPL